MREQELDGHEEYGERRRKREMLEGREGEREGERGR